jgi:hypothetical protein
MPTFVPRPVVTPTLFGAFELARSIDTSIGASLYLPWVQLPDWLELSGDKETWLLTRVQEAYMSLANPNNKSADEGVFRDHYANVIVTADDFLGQYPDSDGAIPVLMMLGHVHSYQVDWQRAPELLGQEYEQAIELLMQRHPERLPYVLNDLIDLGLPINWVQSGDLGMGDGEILLFTYQFSYGEPKGQALAFVKEPDSPWVFASIPTQYADGWKHSVRLHTIADINADGQAEVVVHLHHAYAGGTGLCVQVFTWDEGIWTDRVSWRPLGRLLYGSQPSPDAYYGESWLEDLDEDGIQEIVVSYVTGPPGGGNPSTVDIYQWDQATGMYTDTLPIKVQICGYHAFAEAERRRALGDLAGAISWYEEARRRWLAELDTPNSVCVRYPYPLTIAQSYQIQIAVQRQMSDNADSGGWGIYVNNLNDAYQVEAGETVVTERATLTGTLLVDQVQISLFQCDVEPCRIVGRFYPFTAYVQDWPSGNRLVCTTDSASHDYEDYDRDGWIDLRLRASWQCQVMDEGDMVLFGQQGPDLETTCLWDGHRFALSGSPLITPSTVLTGSLDAYPQLLEIEQDLLRLLDCSGDE